MERQADTTGPVTISISRQVIHGREAAYEEWVKGITAEALKFSGHMGVHVIRPTPPSRKYIDLSFRQLPSLPGLEGVIRSRRMVGTAGRYRRGTRQSIQGNRAGILVQPAGNPRRSPLSTQEGDRHDRGGIHNATAGQYPAGSGDSTLAGGTEAICRGYAAGTPDDLRGDAAGNAPAQEWAV